MTEPVVIRANDAIYERLIECTQAAPERCQAAIFDGERRCHRDEGHWGAHVSYAEKGEGKIGWRNDAPQGEVGPVAYARAVLRGAR